MGYFDAATSCLFREDASGRRLFKLYGRRYYLVPPGRELRIKRTFLAYTLVSAPALMFTALPPFWIWPSLLSFAALTLGYYLAMAWAVRPLERTDDPDLKPYPYAAALDDNARALGRPLLRVFALGSTLMTLLGVLNALYMPLFGEALQWASVALFALFTVQFLVQLWRTRLDP